MSDYEKMTDAELDEAVAKALGWKFIPVAPCKEWPYGAVRLFDREGVYVYTESKTPGGMTCTAWPKLGDEGELIPHFTRSLDAAIGLLDGVEETERPFMLGDVYEGLTRVGWRAEFRDAKAEAKHPARAIVLAFLAAHDAKQKGNA